MHKGGRMRAEVKKRRKVGDKNEEEERAEGVNGGLYKGKVGRN